MKNLLILLTLLIAILPSAFAADQVTDKVFAITHYAEQYEMGQISYAELRVYSGAIREDVRELMSKQVFGDEIGEHYEGVSEEAAKKFFGEPTEYTSWVWSSKEEKDVKIENKMPRWEKIVYDGKKIQVTFNAWPNVYKGDAGDKYYYWVDFNVRFKNEFNFDITAMQSEIAGLGRAFLEKRGELKEFAGKLVEYSTTMQHYIQQNKENCRDMLQKFFSSDDRSMEQEFISWEAEIYSGDRLTIIASTKLCDSCEWVWADTWFEPRYEGPWFEKFEVRRGAGAGNYKLDDLRQKTMEELLGLLRDQFDKAKKAADSAEKEGGFHIEDIEANIRLLNRAISEVANQNPSLKEQKKEEYIVAIDSIMSHYKTEKLMQKELRYERRLVEDFIDKTNKQCRQVQEEECAIDEGCIDGECRIAIGGDEDCRNNADDDGDTLIDCRDPDCAKSCGKFCKSVCEDECWPCMQQCNSVCKECDDCRNNGGDGEQCNEICSNECDSCRNEKCRDTPVCSECKACEDANREVKEGECDMDCGPCNECIASKESAGEPKSDVSCGEICAPCAICKSPTMNPECLDKCKKITKGFQGMLTVCEDMCNKGVIFYCSGAKQYSPCDDTTYICNGNMQPIPCELFTCINEDGTKRIQTVGCDMQAFCGENQVADKEKCKCRAGFYDCDKDGLSCESEVPCGLEREVCDDETDNDNDYLVDCDDRMDCKTGMPCGLGKVCFDGSCVLKEEANVTAKCPEGMEYMNGKCKCKPNHAKWEDKCVPVAVNISCKEGFVLADGKCMPAVSVPEECPEGFELAEEGCIRKEIAPAENITECEEGYEMKEGKCLAVIAECPAGYELKEGECIPAEAQACPEGYELKENECVFVGEKIECAENEVLEAGKCISKDVFEGNEIRPIETGRTCMLAEDCGSEREVCSNGFCKEIPEEIYEREYGEKVIEEAVSPEIVEEEIIIPPGEEQEGGMIGLPEPEEKEKQEEKEERKEEQQQDKSEKEEPAPEPQEQPEPAQQEGITGAFFRLITGFASKEEKCSADEECNSNQQCDKFMGRCHCKERWFDCNGRGDGQDSDGCESEDVTCGGQREICQGGCNDNQYCNEEKGWCECNEGFNDCDGNWMNGCESETMCGQCAADEECSQPVCAPWDNVVLKFGCAEGETWKEENGVVVFSGTCRFRPAGRVDPDLNFDAWGEAFQDVDTMRRSLQTEQFGGWCKFEREGLLKQRKEIEKGLNPEFLAWFFDEYLVAEPDKWENRISGIYDTYWSIVDNARETARTSACLGEKFPEYAPIDIEYESDFGKVHIWEEWKNVKEFENINVLTPYMEIWIFPSKEIFKHQFLKAKEGGYMPGPPEQRLQEVGPSLQEKEEIRKDTKALKEIEDIANKFGGSAEGLLTIKDGEEDVFYIKATVNPDVIFKAQPVKAVDFEPDVNVVVQLDFIYDMARREDQHGEIQSPPWDSGRRVRHIMKNAVDNGVKFAKVTAAFATGDIKVEPLSAVPTLMKLFKIAGEGGPPAAEEK
ncbi:MAG: hypothetical protein KJ955_04915 [Nanoarchaeota archaeon]|nr:hypothetical protein [Nanoarchaeota archaeon]